MPTNKLKLVSAQVESPTKAERAARGPRTRMTVGVEVENQNTKPLHVWASARGYDYDAQSKILTLHLSEQPLAPPPGIIIISQHPRIPAQVEVAPGTRVRLPVEIPAVVRHAAADGQGWVEEPIGDVAHVQVDVQYAPKPIEPASKRETPAEFSARMQAHGEITSAKLKPSSGGASSRKKE